jgi:ribosomal protein L29
VEFANRYHLRLVQTGKGPAFAHPCLLLEGTTCKAYSERPKACQAFRCKLLRQVTDGSLDVGTAVERIAEIRKRIADIEAALAPDERDALWWAAGLLGDPDTNSAQRAELSEMLKAVLSELTTLRQKTNDWIASPDDLSTWSSQEQRDR